MASLENQLIIVPIQEYSIIGENLINKAVSTSDSINLVRNLNSKTKVCSKEKFQKILPVILLI